MFPIGTDRPQRRTPWVNYGLIAANVVIYFLSHAGAGPQAPGGLAMWWAKYMLYGQPELYQFITYQFLHADIMHLLGNMLFLYVFGNGLNEKLGHLGYLLFYLTGGVLAGCAQVYWSGAPTLGASGSISAVTGLFFVLLPRTNVKLFIWIWFFVDVVEIPSMWLILFSVAKDIFESRFVAGSNVAHSAHVAGNFAGFGIGLALLGIRLLPRDHYDLLALVDRWWRRRQYESLVARGYDPFSPTRGVEKKTLGPPPVRDPRVEALRAEIGTLLRAHRVPEAAAKYVELKRIDPSQVLGPQEQLDVSSQLMAAGQYAEAAEGYEDYLRAYPRAPQNEQVELILGVIYARYLPRPGRAVELLKGALERLHDAGQRAMAEAELARLTRGTTT